MVSQTMPDQAKDVDPQQQQLIYNIKLSSVGPGNVTGQNVEYDPSDMDLAMKLHYLRIVYFFPAESVRGLTVRDFKESCFTWLNYYYKSCGRFRRRNDDKDKKAAAGGGGTGRPYVKCNDCGVRFLEAKSDFTLQQWVDRDTLPSSSDAHRLLVPNQVLGPELTFSPQVLLQLTFLKCGGLALGMSWAHVLGDAFSATQFINAWGMILSGNNRPTTHLPNLGKAARSSSTTTTSNDEFSSTSPKSTLGPGPDPLSVNKTPHPVGDHWLVVPNHKMETHSFTLKLTQITTTTTTKVNGTPPAAFVCAVMWKSIAMVREGKDDDSNLNRVTVVRGTTPDSKMSSGNDVFGNRQMVGVVEIEEQVMEADVEYLAELVRDGGVDERSRIAETVRKENGMVDLVVYGGANLTFVDYCTDKLLLDWYGFELREGNKPVFVNCFVDGVGEQGLVVVMPGKQAGEMVVNVTVMESEMGELKQVMADKWGIGGAV